MSKKINRNKTENHHEILKKVGGIMDTHRCSVKDVFELGLTLLSQSCWMVLGEEKGKKREESKEELIKSLEHAFIALTKDIREWKKPEENKNE